MTTTIKVTRLADNKELLCETVEDNRKAWAAFALATRDSIAGSPESYRQKVERALRLGQEQGHCTLVLNGEKVEINETVTA